MGVLKMNGYQILSGAVLACTLAASGQQAQTSGSMPDAQVEANVLRQLASASDLSAQNVQSSTVYGTVTLTGSVQTEELRTKAENLAARADGVKKVVDELTLGTPVATPAGADQMAAAPADQQQSGQLQSDGTYAPQGSDPSQGNMAQPAAQPYNNAAQPYNNQPYASQPPAYNQGQPNQSQPGYSSNQPGYAPNQGGYDPNQPPPGYANGSQPSYSQPAPPPGRQPLYNGYSPAPGSGRAQGGQPAGLQVTVPGGVLLSIRINRGIDSNHIKPGTPFDGLVMNDVVAGGAVAIPRGASVQGVVVDAKKAGALKGQGELALALNTLTLGGQTYQIASIPWDREGRDKTVSTVNSALGLGVLGAIVGGVAGGGAGAAIGAGVGGAAGVAGSAASPGGRVIIPPESILTFHLANPTLVTTVSQQEMARLSYAAGPALGQPVRRRYYSPYNGYYNAPYPPPGPGYYAHP